MGRSPCCDKNGLKKGPWMPEEDAKLIQYIEIHGPQHWRTLPKNAGLQRCGKSCRLRWINYLRPDIKRGRFSLEEEETIIQLHSVLGNKWSAIAARLPGRTDNEIKNYWNTRIRKRLLKTGIDPVTHAPRLNLLDLSSQLNLSNLLLQLQTLLNPQALAVSLSLLSSNNDNHRDYSIEKLQENQLLKPHDLPQNQASPIFQPNQFENVMGQEILSHLATTSFPTETLSDQAKTEHPSMNYINSCSQIFEHNVMTTATTGVQTLPSNPSTLLHGASNQLKGEFPELPDISNFNSIHLSSPACPNSASTFVSGSTEDNESESLCSSLLRFEIPDSLDLDYFM